MNELLNRILAQIDLEIDEIDLYGYDIIETSLSMVHKLQTVLDDLRIKIQTYVFINKEDEILERTSTGLDEIRTRGTEVPCFPLQTTPPVLPLIGEDRKSVV